MAQVNTLSQRYPTAVIDLLQRARAAHRREEQKLRDAHVVFLDAWSDLQAVTGADRALFRGAVRDAVDALREARGDVLLAAYAIDGACAAVEGVRS